MKLPRMFTLTAAIVGVTALTSSAYADAYLSDAVVLWNFDSLDDANGLNSSLTIVNEADTDAGTIATNLDGSGFWAGQGPGSDDRYANGQTGTDRVGTYFDAGQGASNELQITGAHTFLWRGEFKDLSTTGYLWSKYDHTVGPNAVKNRSSYLRYNPGGDLDYHVDDADGGAAGVSISLADGAVSSGGGRFEIITVFDPANDQASIYVLNPSTRAVLASNTETVGFDLITAMAGPVPFTLGDRLAWSGTDWGSTGASGARVDIEMFAAWNQAFTVSELTGLGVTAPEIPEPTSLAILAISSLTLLRNRTRRVA